MSPRGPRRMQTPRTKQSQAPKCRPFISTAAAATLRPPSIGILPHPAKHVPNQRKVHLLWEHRIILPLFRQDWNILPSFSSPEHEKSDRRCGRWLPPISAAKVHCALSMMSKRQTPASLSHSSRCRPYAPFDTSFRRSSLTMPRPCLPPRRNQHRAAAGYHLQGLWPTPRIDFGEFHRHLQGEGFSFRVPRTAMRGSVYDRG